MTSYGNALDDALAGGSGRTAFTKDSPIGTSITGDIVDAKLQQMRDYVTKEPEFWGDGNPKNQIVISIQTNQSIDADDDGIRAIYIKTWGAQKQALADAVKNAGGTKLTDVVKPGSIFTATFTATRPSKQGSDEKLYTYEITPAPTGLDQAITQPPAQAPTPAPVAPVATQPAPQETPAVKAKQLAALGIGHDIIAAQLGVDPSIVPALLAS